jgi:Cof subfamily protein (haloacid dehalogenase superfamily)
VNKHLYITDLDGTLLRNDQSISSYSHSKLKQLINEKQVHFTVATARSYRYTKEVLRGIDVKLPVILKNGAVTADFSTGNHINVNYIDHEYWQELIDDIGEYMLSPFMSTFNGVSESYYYDQITGDGMQWYIKEMQAGNDKRLMRLPTLHMVTPEELVLSVSVINKLDVIEKLREELQYRYRNILHCHFYEELYHKGWYWAVFTNKLATKDQAIKLFCEKFDYDINYTTAFGDSYNDKSMLEVVKHKIAVSNADKRLIDIATEVIGSNEEDSVIKYIESRH